MTYQIQNRVFNRKGWQVQVLTYDEARMDKMFSFHQQRVLKLGAEITVNNCQDETVFVKLIK